MKEIPLTQGKVALVDDADFERVNQFKWCAARQKYTWYAIRKITPIKKGKRKTVLMHNFLTGGRTDHIDGNGLDNRRLNLRLATHSQNMRAFQTKRSGCTSKYRGVSWKKGKGKWLADIRANGKLTFIGYFSSEEEAARAYNTAALARDTKFHHLNLVS